MSQKYASMLTYMLAQSKLILTPLSWYNTDIFCKVFHTIQL